MIQKGNSGPQYQVDSVSLHEKNKRHLSGRTKEYYGKLQPEYASEQKFELGISK
jgi:hypothetical protein